MRRAVVLFAFCATSILAPRAASAAPWLAASDLHVNLSAPGAPSTAGSDTNAALLAETIAAMRRADPNPPVVVLAGDFLAHRFRGSAAAATMAALAKRFDVAFPRAQFVILLGNNDAACGDYRAREGGDFLRAVARAWEPLVNRRGAAPDFAHDFSLLGAYVTRLPGGVRGVVIDDTFWSVKYRNACGAAGSSPGRNTLAWLARALATTPRGETNWLFAHIPPGVDAFSTGMTKDLLVFSFLQPQYVAGLRALVSEPRNRVALAIGGHTHKFAFRFIGSKTRDVPMLLIPSISPVYGNSPAFLTLNVADRGLRDARERAFVGGHWKLVGGLASTFGLPDLSVAALQALNARLNADPAVRARFGSLYDGEESPAEFNESTWADYYCASVTLDVPAWRTCRNARAPSRFPASFFFVVALLATGAVLLVWLGRNRARGVGDPLAPGTRVES